MLQPSDSPIARLRATVEGNKVAAAVFAIGSLVVLVALPIVAVTQPRWASLVAAVGLALVEASFLLWTGLDAKKEHTGLAIAFGVLGITVFGLWAFRLIPIQGLGLLGLILAYTAIGHVLLVWRRATRWPPLRGLIWLAACFAAFVFAWALLTPATPRSSGGLTIVGFVLLAISVLTIPVGLSLLSEDVLQRIRLLPDANAGRVIVALVLGGILLIAGTVVVLLWSPDGRELLTARPVLVVTVVVLALLGAVVSNTRLDTIVVALLLVALLFVAPDRAPAPPDPDQGPVLVALGDSYISGEGAEAFYEGTDVADKNECRRAPSAYPETFARENDAFPGGVVSFACSGARAAHLVSVSQYPNERAVNRGAEPGMPQLNQLGDLLDSGIDVELVLLSIGGNDSGFSTIGMTCVAPGDCDTQESLWLDNLRQVRLALRTAYANVDSTLKENGASEVPVVVVPYPDPLNEQACDDVTLAQSEVDFLHRFMERLDGTIKSEAERAGFTYLEPMVGSLARDNLRLCDGGSETGVNFVSPQSVNGSLEQWANPKNWVHSSFHPDEDGHAAMAAVLTEWWTANAGLERGAAAPATQNAADDSENLEVVPQCSMVEVGNKDQDRSQLCTGKAQLWALKETRAMLIPAGLLALSAGFGGAWLLWLALFAQLHRRRDAAADSSTAGSP